MGSSEGVQGHCRTQHCLGLPGSKWKWSRRGASAFPSLTEGLEEKVTRRRMHWKLRIRLLKAPRPPQPQAGDVNWIDLSTPDKKHRLSDWTPMQGSTICYLHNIHFKYKYIDRLKTKKNLKRHAMQTLTKRKLNAVEVLKFPTSLPSLLQCLSYTLFLGCTYTT